MDQKVLKILNLLPENKQIFIAYAQFQNVLQVPQQLRSRYFDSHLNQIAVLLANDKYFTEKPTHQIQSVDVIQGMMQILEESSVRFKLQNKKSKKPEPTPQISTQGQTSRGNTAAEVSSPRQQRQGKYPSKTNNQLQYHPQHQQQYHPQTQPPNQASTQTYLQQKPLTYYHQSHMQQGRPNVVKYTVKQAQKPQQGHVQAQNLAARRLQQHQQTPEKQNYGWIDGLSKCLSFPEKRYYLLQDMHPRKKF